MISGSARYLVTGESSFLKCVADYGEHSWCSINHTEVLAIVEERSRTKRDLVSFLPEK